MAIVDYASLPEFPMRPGISGKWMAGVDRGSSNVRVLWNTLEADAAVPRHFHESEEVIMAQEGMTSVTVGDATRAIAAGELAIVPPNSVHAWGTAGSAPARVL